VLLIIPPPFREFVPVLVLSAERREDDGLSEDASIKIPLRPFLVMRLLQTMTLEDGAMEPLLVREEFPPSLPSDRPPPKGPPPDDEVPLRILEAAKRT
jgi:hypothetical protein